MINFLKVVCIKNCESLGGAKYYRDKVYNAQFMNKSYYIYDDNNENLRIEIENSNNDAIFSKYFICLTEQRLNKLNKINKLNKNEE